MQGKRIVVVGAGIGGLAAAMILAAEGLQVTVLEKAATPGGKMREIIIGERSIDSGPTVLTLCGIFEELFARAGASLRHCLRLEKATVLARHFWDAGGVLDLYADQERSADSIGRLAGAEDAKGFKNFCKEARKIYCVLDKTFICAQKPSLPELIWRIGLHRLHNQWLINPYESLWKAVCRNMKDRRLRQLFARYATYCGSSPFLAPATLMLVAHAEQQGVWLVEGGMQRLAEAMAQQAARSGAIFRFNAEVSEVLCASGRTSGIRLKSGETIPADAVVVNADSSAAGSGHLGPALKSCAARVPAKARSLSALTWSLVAKTSGLKFARHTIFFPSADYSEEFASIFSRGTLPEEPAVYVCAQDRDSEGHLSRDGPERLLFVVNAPAHEPPQSLSQSEIETCEKKIFALMARCGAVIRSSRENTVRTAPADFAALFPGTGGAIYGRASHGWTASFRRQGARGRVRGLYFAGGSVHPGPGAPMAALSGRFAAEALLKDFALQRRFHRAVMPGGILTPSATAANTD